MQILEKTFAASMSARNHWRPVGNNFGLIQKILRYTFAINNLIITTSILLESFPKHILFVGFHVCIMDFSHTIYKLLEQKLNI